MPGFKQFPCVANGLIFIASVDNKLFINVRIYQISHILREIRLIDYDTEALHLRLNADCNPQIVNFRTCVEPDTGLSLPVLVVLISSNDVKISSADGVGASLSSNRVYIFGIQYTSHRKEILPLKYCQIEHQICHDITVLNNITIIWLQNELLHTAVPSTHNKTILHENQHQISKDIKNVAKEQLIWAGKLQGIFENNYLILCRVTKHVNLSETDMFLENDHYDVSFQFLLVLFTQECNGQWCEETLNVSDIIPEMYAPNLVNLFVITCKLKHSVIKTSCANPSKTPRACETSIYSHAIALLEDGYFLELKCGEIQRCFQLDHPGFQNDFSCEIIGLLGANSMEQFAVIKVLSSQGTDCFAVDLNNRKVSHHWTNVQYIMTGDFIHLGKQQLLILFSDWSFESHSGSWVLTDFGVTQIDTRQQTDVSSSSEDIDTSSSIQAVVKSLASRLQKSRISLEEDENDLTKKKQFILSTWSQLQQRSIGNEISGCSELMVPMVTLVEGCQTSGISAGNTSTSSQSSRKIHIHSEQMWQRVVGDRWVVGIKAVNNSERSITDCVLSLVCKSLGSTKHNSTWPPVPDDKDDNPVAITSLHGIAKRLKLDVDSLPLASKDKKIIRHGESATVACCTSISSLDFQKQISCSVILYFVELHEPDTHSNSTNTDVQSVCCGEVVLRVQDYIDGKYSVCLTEHTVSETSIESQELVRTAMDCAQLTVQLRVCSTFSRLGTMETLLVQQAGLIFHKVTQSFIGCHCEALNLVRIHIQSVISSHEVILRVSARDESQILVVVQYLYSHLPDDISILLNNERDSHLVIRNSLSRIANEIHNVTTAARDLCSADHDLLSSAGDGFHESVVSDTVSKIQDGFKKQQCAFQNQTQGRVSKDKYDEFLKQIQMHERHTDNSVSHIENF